MDRPENTEGTFTEQVLTKARVFKGHESLGVPKYLL